MRIDPKQHAHRDVYKLMIGSIIPRPIALVSSLSPSGARNLAPFSFFNGVCSDPPIVLFSTVVRNDGSSKDTLRNIEATKEYVINVVSEQFVVPMNACSEDFPPEVDEFKVSGLTPVASEKVRPARVAESRISMECRLVQVVSFGSGGPGSGSTVFGEIVLFHVADELLNDFRIDSKGLRAVGRMGGPQYCRTSDVFDLPRPGTRTGPPPGTEGRTA